ncbi:MAG TPA: alanine racemase, partial [Blastocatellia bacterium]|nr:alanine racemase [Blastocatellia bacterium]
MFLSTAHIGTASRDIDTPAVLIDIGLMERNIERAHQYLAAHNVFNRPHVKTHKIPAIAHRQMAAGAIGIACQKLSEAEVMADAGFPDIQVTFNIVGRQKLDRLIALSRRARITVTADDMVLVRALSEAARGSEVTIPVLVECDTGQHRCGVATPERAVELAQGIAALPGVQFLGLMTYPTSRVAGEFVSAAARMLRSVGLRAEVISGGGTPSLWQLHEIGGFTEHRAGEYIFNDRTIIAAGTAAVEDCALRVIATVVSRPAPSRAVIDAGTKTLTAHPGLGVTGYGYVVEYPEATIDRLTEEHGILDVGKSGRKPEIGETLTIIPNRASVVVNLHDVVYGIRNGRVETVWP